MSSQQSKDFQELVASLKDFNPRALTDEVIRVGEAWAENDAAATTLEETKKTLLAKLTLEYLAGGHSSGAAGERPKAMSVAQAEVKALADDRYEQHIELMVQARGESHRSRVRYDLGKMRLELMRSVQATMRNEMRLHGQL